jgi:nitroreductase
MHHIPYNPPQKTAEDVLAASKLFVDELQKRRSVRFFSDAPVAKAVIENLVKAAGSAPSGANKQPWHFVAVSNAEVKKRIRLAAEAEEKAFYAERATPEWLKDLEPIGTDWQKPFLEIAPWLIIIFKKTYNETPEGRTKNYYVQESVGIACGFLIAAIHQAGLATLTHTPSPMNFLAEILQRPENEKPFLLLPVGYPAPNATVPNIARMPLQSIASFIE